MAAARYKPFSQQQERGENKVCLKNYWCLLTFPEVPNRHSIQ